jgi:hypothetical protein
VGGGKPDIAPGDSVSSLGLLIDQSLRISAPLLDMAAELVGLVGLVGIEPTTEGL